MATREELEEKFDECQETPEFVAVALEAFNDLGDKEWAVEVFEEGAGWAATAKDYLALLNGAKIILQDDDKTAEYFEQAKKACRNADELIELAVAAADSKDENGARDLFRAAGDKATKAAEFLGLAKKVTDTLGDKELASELSAKGQEKCSTPADYADLARGLAKDFNDPEQAKEVLSQAVESCKSGADYSALAASAGELFPDSDLGVTIYQSAEQKIESGLEMGSLAKEAVAALGDKEYGAKLFARANEMLESGEDLVKLAALIHETIADKEMTLAAYKKAGDKFSTFREFDNLADAVLKDTGDKDYAGQAYKLAAKTEPDTPKLVSVAEKMADDIGDLDAAIEILHQAENAVKSNDEFKVMAEAVLKYGKEQQWLDDITLQKEKRENNSDLYEGFIQRELDAQVAAALWNLGHDVIQTTKDPPYARKLFAGAEKLARHIEDYITLAEFVVKDLDDKEWASRIYEQQFDAVTEFARKRKIVEAIVEVLQDQAKGRDYLKNMEADCNRPAEFIKLGITVHKILKDEGWTRSLFQEALVNSTDRYTLLNLAGKIITYLADRKWAEEIYDRIADESSDKFDFEHLFLIVEQQSNDLTVLEKLHEKAETRLKGALDLMALAESVARRLESQSWASKLYKKTMSAPGFEKAKHTIATSVDNTLGDSKLSGSIRLKSSGFLGGVFGKK